MDEELELVHKPVGEQRSAQNAAAEQRDVLGDGSLQSRHGVGGLTGDQRRTAPPRLRESASRHVLW